MGHGRAPCRGTPPPCRAGWRAAARPAGRRSTGRSRRRALHSALRMARRTGDHAVRRGVKQIEAGVRDVAWTVGGAGSARECGCSPGSDSNVGHRGCSRGDLRSTSSAGDCDERPDRSCSVGPCGPPCGRVTSCFSTTALGGGGGGGWERASGVAPSVRRHPARLAAATAPGGTLAASRPDAAAGDEKCSSRSHGPQPVKRSSPRMW